MDFRKKYLLAIAVTTLLIVTNQVVIQYFLAQKRYDAKVINVSGKQRMLSQRLMGLMHAYHLEKNEQVKKDIEKDFEEWKAVHYGLINGDKDLNLMKLSKDKVLKLEKISFNIVYAEKLLNEIDNLNIEKLKEFRTQQSVFLTKMNKIVKSLEKSSEKKLNIIVIIEILLALLTLSLLYIEILRVLLPTVRHLALQNKMLQKNNKILEEYAYIASHDLRTPIINIISFSDLLEKQAAHKLNDKELKYLNFIKKGAKQMNEVTKDLLSYGTVNQVVKNEIEVKALIGDVIAKIQHEIQKNNAIIKVEQLPENIFADEKMIALVFENLILNAIKFVNKGEQAKIEISSFKKKKLYVFVVKDSGIGIADANKQKIFGVFKRLHNQKEYSGTGIGLALCKRIVEGHQGEIWVENTEQKGSTFYFTLPINSSTQ